MIKKLAVKQTVDCIAPNAKHCRSLGICCCVRPVLLLFKGTNYFYDYQSGLINGQADE